MKTVAVCTAPSESATHRVRFARVPTGLVTVGYGTVLFALLIRPAQPRQSAYGRAGAAAIALVAATLAVDLWLWRRRRTAPLCELFGAVALLGAAALHASMATQPAPRFLAHEFSTWDIFLGYALPGPSPAHVGDLDHVSGGFGDGSRIENIVEIRILLDGLEPERREALVLTQVLGMTYAEATEIAGCPIGTIRSRVARARDDLIRANGAEDRTG